MPVAARTLLGLAGAVFFQAEDPLKEKHRSGGVGRTKFSEVDRGVSRNIVLAGSARCCFALRVIRLTGLHASQGLAFFEGSNSLSFDFQSAPQHEGRKKASSCAVEELLRLRAMFSAILPPSPGEKAAECAGELVGRFCLRQAEKIRQGVRRASRAEGMAHQQGRGDGASPHVELLIRSLYWRVFLHGRESFRPGQPFGKYDEVFLPCHDFCSTRWRKGERSHLTSTTAYHCSVMCRLYCFV